MAINSKTQRMTVDRYLEWEAVQDIRHEYMNGKILAMTGHTICHHDIVLKLYMALHPQIQCRDCRLHALDIKVQITPTGPFFYPDLIISCDDRDRAALQMLQHPLLVIEILSSKTATYDRGKKFAHYRRLSTLREYVVVESEQTCVECYRRRGEQNWAYEPYGDGDTLYLESIGVSCPVNSLYPEVASD